MTPRLFATRAARKAFLTDATRQLGVEILAGTGWIFGAFARAARLGRRMALRITARAPRQA